MDIFLFPFFSIAHTILFWHMKFLRERDTHDKVIRVLFWWMEKCMLCITLSVRVSNFFVGVCVSWSWVHGENLNTGHNNLTKLNAQTSSIWLRFWIWISSHMALVGVHNYWGTFDFSNFKMKSLDVKSLLEQTHSKFYLYHIITRNNLENEHAFATHKFSSFRMWHV
jgi:hypothetical protein